MPIAPSSLVHVVYRTRRFEQMLTWYTTVFAARIQYRNPALAFLTFDDEHHRFAFADLGVIRPDEDDKDERGMIGVDHVAWEYASLRDLLDNYAGHCQTNQNLVQTHHYGEAFRSAARL